MSDTPPSRLSSAILSSFKVTCSNLVTFQFKPSNKSWKGHFWNFFCQLWKNCCWIHLVHIIFDKKTEKILFFGIFLIQNIFFMAKFEFYRKNAFFWGIYCCCSSKIAKIEIFRIFGSNCTKTVIFQFFSAFCKKKEFWKWPVWPGNDLSFQKIVFLELCDAPELS